MSKTARESSFSHRQRENDPISRPNENRIEEQQPSSQITEDLLNRDYREKRQTRREKLMERIRYGRSWGPGGQVVALIWGGTKSFFGLLAKPFKWLITRFDQKYKLTPEEKAKLAEELRQAEMMTQPPGPKITSPSPKTN